MGRTQQTKRRNNEGRGDTKRQRGYTKIENFHNENFVKYYQVQLGAQALRRSAHSRQATTF
jgi:hypothetical protein